MKEHQFSIFFTGLGLESEFIETGMNFLGKKSFEGELEGSFLGNKGIPFFSDKTTNVFLFLVNKFNYHETKNTLLVHER